MTIEECKVIAAKRYEDVITACNKGDMEELKALMVCGLMTEDDFPPVLDDSCAFKYKGYHCWLSSCNAFTNKEQVFWTAAAWRNGEHIGVFEDKYVCFILGKRNLDGLTYDEMKTEEDKDCWCAETYLLPTFLWGAEYDMRPGKTVDELIIETLDKFLSEHPNI